MWFMSSTSCFTAPYVSAPYGPAFQPSPSHQFCHIWGRLWRYVGICHRENRKHRLLYHVTEPLWCHPAEDSGGWGHQLLYNITHLSYENAEDYLTLKMFGKQLYRAKLCHSNKKNKLKKKKKVRVSPEILLLVFLLHLKNRMTSNFPFTIYS